MDVEIKPVEEVKDELPQFKAEPHPMDTSGALNETNESISDGENHQQKGENSDSPRKPRERKKRKKGKKIVRSKDYPKYYQNAYVRFCNEIRPKVCLETPEMDPVEVTKLVANMWYKLPNAEKQPYLDQSKIDKERFKRELKEFNKLNPDEIVGKKRKKLKQKDSAESPEKKEEESTEGPKKKRESKKRQRKGAKSVPTSLNDSEIQPSKVTSPIPSTSKHIFVPQPPPVKKDDELPKTFFIGMDCELPIFTDAFLEHNKTIEAELKILRKNSIEMDQHNSVLMKHVENMENGVRKVESEIALTKKKNMQLEVYLTKLRCLLAANFHSLPIPGSGNKGGATVENIDKYMSDLANEAKKPHSATANKAREIMKNVDLKIMP